MISNRPYIIRAIYDWVVDNEWTPHMQVDANYPGTNVPQEFVQDGVIVLNVAPAAVVGLNMDNDWFSFKARFQGVERELGFAPEAVLAVFARENGQGMPFPPEPYPDEADEDLEEANKPSLSAVKDSDSTPAEKTAEKPDKAEGGAKKGAAKKPTLSIVK
jgi:stringent starvation protein B